MSKVYVAIGFEEFRLEMVIARVSPTKEMRITLRHHTLAEPVVCQQTGTLLSQTAVLTYLGNSLKAFITRGPVQVLIGIPDHLCRMRIVRTGEIGSGVTDSSETLDPSSKGVRVFSTFTYQSAGETTDGLLVAAPRVEILRYVELFSREPYELSAITPGSICRYNYLLGRTPGLADKSHILVHLSESSCTMAVWSAGLPRYHERLPREGSLVDSVERWLERVVAVSRRSGRSSEIILRGPTEIVTAAEQNLVNARGLNERTADLHDCGYSLEGEVLLGSQGCFDVTLGLLALEMRRRRTGD